MKGCVHLIVKGGKITNVFIHVDDKPKDGVIHLSVDGVMTNDEFLKSHPKDAEELTSDKGSVVYDLGDRTISYYSKIERIKDK